MLNRSIKKAPIRDEGSVTYSAALESAFALDTAAARSPFTERVWREATRRRFCQAPRTVVLGDGALWIWNIADDQFPDATQIVDRFHAKRHLSDLEKLFPVPPPHGLFNGRNVGRKNSTPENSRRYSPPSVARCTAPRTRVAVSTISSDFQTNRERMRYPEFHAQGLCTSTGVVEAARSPLAHGPNVPECSGPFAALTPSLLSAAQNSVVVFKTSGSADQNAGPHDPSLSWSAPVPIDLLDACHAPALFPNSRLRDHNGEDFTSRPATSPQNAVHCSFFPDSNFAAHRNIGAAHELRQNRSPLCLCRIFQATKMSMNTESGSHDE